MAARIPLVLVDGQPQELPATDTLGGAQVGIPVYCQEANPLLNATPAVAPFLWLQTDGTGAVIDILMES